MTPEAAVERARRAVGRGCLYGLGQGGFDPDAEWPWGSKKLCDCSGFIAWCLGLNRHVDHPRYAPYYGNWLETTAIVRDAKGRFGFFDEVSPALAILGDLLVYGDRVNQDGTRRQGHIGIVSEVGPSGPVKAIHCSKGNERHFGDAIHETDSGLWVAGGGILARYSEWT